MEKKIIAGQKQNIIKYLIKVLNNTGLLFVFSKRDLKSEYAQTFLGIVLQIIKPLVSLIIYVVFFGIVFKVSTKNIPFPLFVYSGLIIWYNFNQIINSTSTVFLRYQDIIKKIYFPKLVLPLSRVLISLIDFFISFILLIIMMIFYKQSINLNILFFLIVILLNIMLSLGIGLWINILSLKYRDIIHIFQYSITLLIWLTPIFYPISIFPEKFNFIIYLNPLTGIIELFRWTLFNDLIHTKYLLINLGEILFIFISGLIVFIRKERKIVDLI